MKILVIGGGGREHALVWKLRQSPLVEQAWCAPGSGGISDLAGCIAVDWGNVDALTNLAVQLKPDLTVVGPELPLVRGIVDEFAKHGLAIVGPSKAAAELEGSKIFAKQFMQKHGIPAAETYGIFNSAVDAYTSLCAVDWPVVVKADGLCGGKGVLVTSSPDEATAFIERVMEKREFGDAGNRLLIEEGLTGDELSYIVLTDGEHILPLAPTRDHKRAFDGSEGPNTGGMGAYSIDSLLPKELDETIRTELVEPTVRGMATDGRPYKGFLYFGLMLTEDGPKVLEFNCRLGDPETQALMLRANFDLAGALSAGVSGKLDSFKPTWEPASSVCVVLASGGYPGSIQVDKQITGLADAESVPGAVIFHAGTRKEGPNYYTSGGRVLSVCAPGPTVKDAAATAYSAASRIHFDGMHYRKDIGLDETKGRAAKGG